MVRKPAAHSRFALWLSPHVEVAPKRAFGMIWPMVIAGYLGFEAPYILARFFVAFTGHATINYLPIKTQHEIFFSREVFAAMFAATVLGLRGLWYVGGPSIRKFVGGIARSGFLILIPFVGLMYAAAVASVLAPYGLIVAVPQLVFYVVLTPLHYVPAFRRALSNTSMEAAAVRSAREVGYAGRLI